MMAKGLLGRRLLTCLPLWKSSYKELIDKTACRMAGEKWLNCITRWDQKSELLVPERTGPTLMAKNWKTLPSFWSPTASCCGRYHARLLCSSDWKCSYPPHSLFALLQRMQNGLASSHFTLRTLGVEQTVSLRAWDPDSGLPYISVESLTCMFGNPSEPWVILSVAAYRVILARATQLIANRLTLICLDAEAGLFYVDASWQIPVNCRRIVPHRIQEERLKRSRVGE